MERKTTGTAGEQLRTANAEVPIRYTNASDETPPADIVAEWPAPPAPPVCAPHWRGVPWVLHALAAGRKYAQAAALDTLGDEVHATRPRLAFAAWHGASALWFEARERSRWARDYEARVRAAACRS